MTLITRGLDLLLWTLGAAAWGLAVYVLSARFIDDTAGALLGLAVGVSGMGYVLMSHMRDLRLQTLTRGRCPSCSGRVRFEHRHRAWDPTTVSWAAPSTSWECATCGYNYSESWACPQCPQ